MLNAGSRQHAEDLFFYLGMKYEINILLKSFKGALSPRAAFFSVKLDRRLKGKRICRYLPPQIWSAPPSPSPTSIWVVNPCRTCENVWEGKRHFKCQTSAFSSHRKLIGLWHLDCEFFLLFCCLQETKYVKRPTRYHLPCRGNRGIFFFFWEYFYYLIWLCIRTEVALGV